MRGDVSYFVLYLFYYWNVEFTLELRVGCVDRFCMLSGILVGFGSFSLVLFFCMLEVENCVYIFVFFLKVIVFSLNTLFVFIY